MTETNQRPVLDPDELVRDDVAHLWHHILQHSVLQSQEPMIVVETKECSGETGVASFRAGRVFKVQAGKCQDPDAPDRSLYQVLLYRASGDSGDYEVLWVDSAGADSIAQQLRENREFALLWHRCGNRPDAAEPIEDTD